MCLVLFPQLKSFNGQVVTDIDKHRSSSAFRSLAAAIGMDKIHSESSGSNNTSSNSSSCGGGGGGNAIIGSANTGGTSSVSVRIPIATPMNYDKSK
jgi:hypothetical protein